MLTFSANQVHSRGSLKMSPTNFLNKMMNAFHLLTYRNCHFNYTPDLIKSIKNFSKYQKQKNIKILGK